MADYREFHLSDFDIAKPKRYMLTKHLITACLANSYSICTEFVRDWIRDKFAPDFFSYEHVSEANVLKEAQLEKRRILSHLDATKASLVITPIIEEDYNRDGADLAYGAEQMLRKDPLQAAFWSDIENNRHISMETQLLSMQFETKITVHTRMQQLQLYEWMKLAFNVGMPETFYVDQDFLLPRTLMLCIAEDAGFGLNKDGDIDRPLEFLAYLNKWSMTPILYKIRPASRCPEFYVRMPQNIIRILRASLTKDDGTSFNHLHDMYNINFNFDVKIGAPRFYEYHAADRMYSYPKLATPNPIAETFYVSTHRVSQIPEMNERGWRLYVKDLDCLEEEDLDNPMIVEFRDYFEGELRELIDNHMARGISPSLFMDLRIYNAFDEVKGTVDWDTMVFKSFNPTTSTINSIALYMDMNYVNDQRIFDRKMWYQFNRQGPATINEPPLTKD